MGLANFISCLKNKDPVHITVDKDKLKEAEEAWATRAQAYSDAYIPMHRYPRHPVDPNIWVADPYRCRYHLIASSLECHNALLKVYANPCTNDIRAIRRMYKFETLYFLFIMMGDVIYSENSMSIGNYRGNIFNDPDDHTLRILIDYFITWLLSFTETCCRYYAKPLPQLLLMLSKYSKEDVYRQTAVVPYTMHV